MKCHLTNRVLRNRSAGAPASSRHGAVKSDLRTPMESIGLQKSEMAALHLKLGKSPWEVTLTPCEASIIVKLGLGYVPFSGSA